VPCSLQVTASCSTRCSCWVQRRASARPPWRRTSLSTVSTNCDHHGEASAPGPHPLALLDLGGQVHQFWKGMFLRIARVRLMDSDDVNRWAAPRLSGTLMRGPLPRNSVYPPSFIY